jgi:hypothetical protein
MQHRIDPDHAFRLDTAVMKHTAFLSFADLLAASFNTPYRPTLRRETHPDEINWGHVGSLNHYASLLRQITDSAFKEGEHAE